ncbi:MAG: bifunctional 4-hydroxy-2-oxoglutarate aldolase/2-dehydro-3-deoxy-phosphogluconate aldolase, partial [Pirellulaceae bacterium]
MKTTVTDLIFKTRLVAIVRLDELRMAAELSRALLAGGIVVQEYTLTNPEALRVIGRLRVEVEEFSGGQAFLGLGSVRTLAEAKQAVEAGADFVVTPVMRPEIIEYCEGEKVPILPGAMTPTEIALAWEAGASFVKVFPARSLGSSYIKDVLAPMPYLQLMPTGGIDTRNMRQYFADGAAAVGVGGRLVDAKLVA